MTMWLTISLIFFIVEYLTDWLEVVTLGGLVAGSFVVGLFVVLGLGLTKLTCSKELYADTLEGKERYIEWGKGMVITAAFVWQGVLTVCRVLPGYTLHSNLPHVLFLLLLLPYGSISMHILMKKRELKKWKLNLSPAIWTILF